MKSIVESLNDRLKITEGLCSRMKNSIVLALYPSSLMGHSRPAAMVAGTTVVAGVA